MKIARFTPVAVTWHDAKTEAAQHVSIDNALESYTPCVRTSHGIWMGYACEGTRNEVVCFATDDDRNDEEPEAVAGVSYIPTTIVHAIRRLGPPRKVKKK